MKISLSVTSYSWPPGTSLPGALRDVARRAEDAGVDTLWVADHLLQMDPHARPDEPMLEGYTTLGFLAAATDRMRLGTMVTWASVRPPALLVKAVTTLDVLSSGRAWLGIGAGYRGDEAAMMGLPFPDTATRFAHVEDAVVLARRMWAGDEAPFPAHGRPLERPIGSPRPVSDPRPGILIGGMGETRTLPLVARYADACNLFDIPDGGATIRRKLDVLARACAAIDRPVGDVEVTVSTRLDAGEGAAELAGRCDALAGLGVGHAVLVSNGPWTTDLIGAVGAVAADR
jgi:alkanesulfonate monooxygenase SsuD/methylene tetrahydromethanopterin reductase-like flavin-dependent oxidoreductase (luciferase family)